MFINEYLFDDHRRHFKSDIAESDRAGTRTGVAGVYGGRSTTAPGCLVSVVCIQAPILGAFIFLKKFPETYKLISRVLRIIVVFVSTGPGIQLPVTLTRAEIQVQSA